MAPPPLLPFALFPEKIESETVTMVSFPLTKIAPPLLRAELLSKLEFEMEIFVPFVSLNMAPPFREEFFSNVELVTLRSTGFWPS